MIDSNLRDNFDTYPDMGTYWVKEDALRSLDYDLFFSLGTRYYCDAGCKVCYIAENLKKTKLLNNYGNDLSKLEPVWFKFFEHFGSIRTNDDMFYFKHNHPAEYEWYQQHGHMFELCLTDNSIFRTAQLTDLKIKNIGDVSISSDFIKQVGVETVLSGIKKLHENHGVLKIKYIDCGDPELFKEILDWNNTLGLYNCVHHDFRTSERTIVNSKYAEYQNTWVINDVEGLMQIYRESLHIYYDRFYYSSDDASDLLIDPFYVINGDINIEQFLSSMLKGKQHLYSQWTNRPVNNKFRDYFKETLKYKVNDDFNFIPIAMYPKSAKFFYQMIDNGWIQTPVGIVKPSTTKIVPIMEKA